MTSNFIEAVVTGPEREGEEGIIEQDLITVRVPIRGDGGGKYADKVYPLTNEAYELLRQSLKKDGYLPQYPIIINRQGDLLDGHHRLKACVQLCIRPTFQLKESKNEIEEELFVIDANLARRQLTRFQRAELALRKAPLLAEQARRNMEAGTTLSRQQEKGPCGRKTCTRL